MSHTFELFSMTFSLGIAAIFLVVLLALIAGRFVSSTIIFGLILLTVLLALSESLLTINALPWIFVLCLSVYYFKYSQNKKIKLFSGCVIFVSSVLLLLHLVPGFHNPILIDNFPVSENAPQYTKYFNLDKAILGVLLLAFVVPQAKSFSLNKGLIVFLVFMVCCFLSLSLGLYTGLISFDPKHSDILLGWIITNLFFTCFVEEAFFRGFVQQRIQLLSSKTYWQYISVLLSGVLFGLAHFPGGQTYTIIASIMGSAYAFSYYKTKNIYVAISVHFIFNLLHFSLFTYPFNLT